MKHLRVSVVTPSLNKSFKFQSDWPYNNSQIYLLNSIIEDLKEDEKLESKTNKKGYLFTSKVNYPNNKSLIKQNVYMNKNGNITKVEVVNKEGNAQIIMNFNKIEFNKKYNKDYFELSSILKINKPKEDQNTNEPNQKTEPKEENTNNNQNETNNNSNITQNEKETKQTASINDIVYPMYLPNNTYLTSKEKVNTKNGERLILTFGGDSSFILVEETATTEKENVVIPVNGEFDFLTDVIGIISSHSLSWHSNGIDYYITSDVIEVSELIDIARSISILPVSK